MADMAGDRHQVLVATLTFFAMIALVGCGNDDDGMTPPPPPEPQRAWDLGFYVTPPRFDLPIALANIDSLAARAEVVMIHEELPWTDLLAGMTVADILARDKVDLVAYLRARGLRLYFVADLTDGLSRGQEPPQLRAAGRSITEPAVQQLYRDYVLGFVQTLRPDVIGLTSETNLVRAAAPDSVYHAMVATCAAAAADLAAAGMTTPLMISVQVETAWGRLLGHGPYVGIAQDLADFPYIQVLGLSSYPYFGFARPEDMPADYFARLVVGTTLPVMLCEGGWASATVDTIVSSPDEQARYVRRLPELLDQAGARAAVQTLFTDLDLASIPTPFPETLPLFASLGLMELSGDDFVAKPALAAWDSLWARERPAR